MESSRKRASPRRQRGRKSFARKFPGKFYFPLPRVESIVERVFLCKTFSSTFLLPRVALPFFVSLRSSPSPPPLLRSESRLCFQFGRPGFLYMYPFRRIRIRGTMRLFCFHFPPSASKRTNLGRKSLRCCLSVGKRKIQRRKFYLKIRNSKWKEVSRRRSTFIPRLFHVIPLVIRRKWGGGEGGR